MPNFLTYNTHTFFLNLAAGNRDVHYMGRNIVIKVFASSGKCESVAHETL